MTTPGERLRHARHLKRLSTAELAARVGRSESAVRNQENGTNGIPAALAAQYGRALSVTPEWLLFGEGDVTDRPATDSVPVVGYVSAGASLVQYAEGQGPFDYVPAPRESTPSTVAAAVRGVSLGPAFDEALVFYDDKRSPVTPDLHGKLCVVGLVDGRVLVKVLRPGEDGRFHLTSNTAEEPLWNQDVDWAAKVTDIRPR
jgi:transcriptional regulator with XRE-family HTH domain